MGLRLLRFCGDLVIFFGIIAAFLLPFVLTGIWLAIVALAVINGFDL